MDRAKELAKEAKLIAGGWVSQMPDDYRGKVMFCMALAQAVMVMRKLVPALNGTGIDFIDAVKAGALIWIEAGEPDGVPQTGGKA